jgi:transposase InsO family protein
MGKAKIALFVSEFAKTNNLKPIKVSTIGKVIKRNNLFFAGKKTGKRQSEVEARKRIKLCPDLKDTNPGYLQVDGFKFFYLKTYYLFLTGVEIVTRQAFVKLVPHMSSKQAAIFLKEVLIGSRVKIHTIQTDNGSEFKLYFDAAAEELNLIHLYSFPRHPKTNGFVERFNWTVQDEFLSSFEDLLLDEGQFQKKLTEWVVYYNKIRPHQSLNYLTPFKYQEEQGLCLKSM